ncbi:MAG: LAGLIDADG family homing endonuclease [Deltaproteobacteria bacterium]|nr:LAGLIDADG family homing endonuclease [Deltaproteobacteria bacterium]
MAEKAYIAGIVDGEGTVTLSRKHKNETPSPRVSISNCNLNLLRWIQKKVGRGIIQKKRRVKKHHSNAYKLRILSNSAIWFLNEIKNFLRLKKPQAMLIIKKYKSVTLRNGRYNPVLLEKKMKLVKTMRKLNQR